MLWRFIWKRWTYSSNAFDSKLSPNTNSKYNTLVNTITNNKIKSKTLYGLIAVHVCAVSQCARSGEATVSGAVVLLFVLSSPMAFLNG